METINCENIALLYLMKQDTKDLSLEELFTLYRNTVESVKQIAKDNQKKNGIPTFSFD